jgi:hypothetical protein
MASIFGSIENLIHDTADALIKSNMTTKMSDMYAGFITAGFGVMNDSLKIIRDMTGTPPSPPST